MAFGNKVPLAWRNLTESKPRLFASVAGAAFAVTLMFMENGFRNALLDSMVNVIERIDGEMVLVSPTLYTLAAPYSFPLQRLVQAGDFPEIESASPVYVVTRTGFWRRPDTGEQVRACVIGYPPEDDALDIPELKENRDLWSRPDTAMADVESREEQFGAFEPGMVSEISGRRIEIAGTFSLGINVQTNGNIVMSDRNMMKVFPELDGPSLMDRKVTVGVLQVRPGADLDQLRADLRAALPPDVRVLTKDQFITQEREFWDKVAPVGTVFLIGVVMGFIVGAMICHQVLHADISDRLAEFATLKAMGYSNAKLLRVVLMQAFYLALLGYGAGLLVSVFLFDWVHRATSLPMDLSRNNPLAILALTMVMCLGSGALAARSLVSVDPARLFA